jgi:hypothetical protein
MAKISLKPSLMEDCIEDKPSTPKSYRTVFIKRRGLLSFLKKTVPQIETLFETTAKTIVTDGFVSVVFSNAEEEAAVFLDRLVDAKRSEDKEVNFKAQIRELVKRVAAFEDRVAEVERSMTMISNDHELE